MNWAGKRVFLTGHTGFKGSWLALWFNRMNAVVRGYSLAPPTTSNLFDVARVGDSMESVIGDIRDVENLRQSIREFQPEIVFHLAAQPLVRHSYQYPIDTYSTNVMGTANLLEAIRSCPSVRSVLIVTTDKCYENREWIWTYRENDRLGGHDPYSSSKACAELVVASYRNSFFPANKYAEHGVAIGSARAGNVIGGGDWANDRLIPDIMRAFAAETPARVRNPESICPWQHVLEPLRGYLMLSEKLYLEGPEYGEAWNFGPAYEDARPVKWIAARMAKAWGRGATWQLDGAEHPHEASMLKLDWSKALSRIGWKPAFNLAEALDLTVAWYAAWTMNQAMREITLNQIAHFEQRVGLAAAAAASRDLTR